MRIKTSAVLALLSFVIWGAKGNAAGEVPYFFNYQSYMTNSSSVPLANNSFNLEFKIMDPTGACVLYDETQNSIMSDSSAMISVNVGTTVGSSSRTGGSDPGLTMATVFSNLSSTAIVPNSANCTLPSGYTPAAGDARLLRVIVNGTPITPDATIGSVPTAHVAETLQGIPSSGFIQTQGTVSQTSVAAVTAGASNDASAYHNHNSLYAPIGGSASQNFTSQNQVVSGTLGIGTSTPVAPLDIEKSTGSTLVIGSTGSSGSNTMSLNFDSSGGSTTRASISATDNSNVLTFQTGGATAMTLNANQTASFSSSVSTAGALGTSAYLSLGRYTTGSEPTLSAGQEGSVWENSSNHVLRFWDGTANQTLVEGTTALTGDVNGTVGTTSVVALRGYPLLATAPTTNQIMTYNGSQWTPQTKVNINTPNTADPLAQELIATGASTNKGLVVQGPAAQTANLVETQNASGTALTVIDSAGKLGLVNLTSDPGSFTAADAGKLWYNSTSNQVKYYNGSSAQILGGGSGITSLNTLTAASQSFVNDTNITITSSGSQHTLGFNGQLSLARGGTNASLSATPGGIVYSGASALAMTSAGTSGAPLISGGTAAPTWSTVSLTGGNVVLPTAGSISNVSGSMSVSAFSYLNLQPTSGLVGVGTSSPAAELDVNATSTSELPLAVRAPASTTSNLTNWYVNGTALYTLNNTGTPSVTTDLVSKQYSDTSTTTLGANYLRKDGTTPLTANWNAGGFQIINVSGLGIANTTPGALLDVGSAGTTLGTMRLEGNTSGYVQIQPSAAAGSWTMTLPSSGGTNGYYLQTNGSGGTTWAAPASATLSSLSPASATATLANSNFAQTWNWNSLSTQTALTLGSSSMTSGSLLALVDSNNSASSTGSLLNIAASGASDAAIPISISNAGTGTSLKVTNTGTGTAATFIGGNVGIGTASPTSQLQITGNGTGSGSGEIKLAASGYNNGFLDAFYGATRVLSNAYSTNTGGSGITYDQNGPLSYMELGSGNISFSVAPSGTGGTTASVTTALSILNSGNVGIGTSTPTALLDVAGTINTSSNYQLNETPYVAGDTVSNLFLGAYAGMVISSGTSETFVGDNAGKATTSGASDTYVGTSAGSHNTTGYLNTYVGTSAGTGGTTAANNTIIGAQAVSASTFTGADNVYVGTQAGYNTSSANYNTAVGMQAGYNVTTAGNNTFIGYAAGLSTVSGTANTFVGMDSDSGNASASNVVAVGYASTAKANSSIAIGSSATVAGSATGAIQIGSGTNNTAGSVQFNSQTLIDPSTNVHGGNIGLFVGTTLLSVATTPGYAAAKTACSGAYPGSHLCDLSEMVMSSQYTNSALAGAGTFTIGGGNAGDCGGFTLITGSTAFTWTGGTYPKMVSNSSSCLTSVTIGCCL